MTAPAPTSSRRKVDCQHPQARHEHATYLAFKNDGCRCLPCRAANRRYENARARNLAYGRPTTDLVDATPTREHLARLSAAGVGWQRAAALAGVSASTVSVLLYGRRRQGGEYWPPSRRVRKAFADAILAVPMPTLEQLADGAIVDGTGTRRRLQALVAIGWTQTELARRLGRTVNNFALVLRGDRVVASTARQVRALYEQLWATPGPDGPGRGRALAIAARQGWPPPMAWDDDTIDDPAGEPGLDDVDVVDQVAIDELLAGRATPVTGATRTAAVHQLTAAGHAARSVAALLQMSDRTVARLLAAARPAPTALAG